MKKNSSIKTDKREFLLQMASGTLALALAQIAPQALAQADKPVRLILPNATGSGVDAIARAAQPALSKALDTNVIVENQPGAGGVLGLQTLAKASPDGTTLSIVSNNIVILPSVLKSLPFEVPGDFTPIATIGNTPLVLVVNPQKISATNSRELIALLKEKPDFYNYGSSGNGTIIHLANAMYLDQAKVTARHIPYKGVGPMVTDLMGGQTDMGILSLPSAQQHIKSGALRAIGMCTAKRVAAAPDIATFVEQGMPDYVVEAWFAVVGPKGMNASTIKRVHAALVTAFNDPAVKEVMARQGNTIQIGSAAEAEATFKFELDKYARLVKAAGVEPQ